jgi:hypothetical protein
MNANALPNTTGDQPEVVNVYNNAPQVDDFIESIPTVVKETKAGWRTTEFWVLVVGSLAIVLEGVQVPAKYEGAVAAVLGGLYIVSRGLAKKGVPVVEPASDS